MRLTELQPQFMRAPATEDGRTILPYAESIADADGVLFLCPKCFAENGGPEGTHDIICWQPQVAAEHPPGPGRWSFSGSGFDDLTLTAASSSIHLSDSCGAHFFITNGEVHA